MPKGDMIRDITVQHINDYYKTGQITAYDRNQLLRLKARDTLDQLVDEKGVGGATIAKTIERLQEGWDNLKEVATRDISKDTGALSTLKAEGKAVWAQIQMATALFSAVGEVSGQKVEQIALSNGASAGLARALNHAIDVGTGIIPVGGTTNLLAKGTKKVGERFIGKGSSTATTASSPNIGKLNAHLQEVKEAKEAEAQGLAVIGQALVEDGVEDGLKLLTSNLPSIPNNYVRLYRGSGKPDKTGPIWRDNEMNAVAGQWFTDDLRTAQRFAEDAKLRGLGPGKVLYVDIPRDIAEKAKKANRSFDPAPMHPEPGEHLLPKEWSDKAIAYAENRRQSFIPVQEQLMTNATTIAKQTPTANIDSELRALARKNNLNLEDLFIDRGYTKKQMHAYLSAVIPHAEEVQKLAKAALTGSQKDQVAFARYVHELFTASPSGEGKLNYSKEFQDMLLHWDPERVSHGDFIGAMKTMAEDFAELPKDGIVKTILKNQDGYMTMGNNWWPQAREVYMNLLLPFSAVPAAIGNTIATGNAVAERALGAMFGVSGTVNKEAFYLTKGMSFAVGDAMKAFGDSYRYVNASNVANQGPQMLRLNQSLGGVTRFDYLPAIQGPLGRIVRAPMDTVIGADAFYKELFKRGSYYASAIREAEQTGQANIGQFVANRVANPTREMQIEAKQFAEVNTYQNELGRIGSAVRAGAQAGPLVMYFPFMKSAINLAKYSWARTPGLQLISQQLWKDMAQGGPAADAAVGRLILSNLVGMYYFEAAKDGSITGSGPVDPALRKVWLATHQPYSIKTATGWMPYDHREPANVPIGAIADFVQVIDQMDEPTTEKTGMTIAFSIMRNFAQGTWWGNASQITDALQRRQRGEEPTEGDIRVGMAPVTNVLTGGAIGTRLRQINDPIQRETRSFTDELLNRSAGYSNTLPPKRDVVTGKPVIPPQALGGSWFGLLQPLVPAFKPFETDRIKKEADALGVKLNDFPWSIGGRVSDEFDINEPQPGDKLGVPVTPKQRDRWQTIYSNALYHPEHGIEKQLLDNPKYQEQTRAMRRQLLQGTLLDYRKRAEVGLMIEDQDLGRAVLSSNVTNLLSLVNESKRSQVEQQGQNAIRLFDNMNPQMKQNLMRWGVLGDE